jgi:preprotein translocase subunit SecG
MLVVLVVVVVIVVVVVVVVELVQESGRHQTLESMGFDGAL